MASDSRTYWNTLSASNRDREVSSLSCHMQLDVDSLGPSLSQEQPFSICDFSPGWTYSGVETKVGTFLGSMELLGEIKWGCTFGEIEVSAEVLSDNVIRCQAPLHATGRVPIYITCRNRLACGEVREFECRESSPGIASLSVRGAKEEAEHFQVRLAKLLNLSPERMGLSCPGCDRCRFRSNLNVTRNGDKKDPMRVGDNCPTVVLSSLENRLGERLVYKAHEGGKGTDVLDAECRGDIHWAAGLSYDLVMGLIVAPSGNPNFRDSRGRRTALRWASTYFGRQETVFELLRLGVDPTAVDDTTAYSPGDQTAADVASSQGRKGLAGYIAEAVLSRHISSLSSKQNVANCADATIAAEQATEVAALLAVQFNEGVNEQLSLKTSLAAVRKSAHAAALIQAAHRAKSFRHMQLPKSTDVVSEVSFDLAALGSLSTVRKRGHYEDYLHSAAVKIQQKYRGWKGRKEFLKIRDRIVKIQARVRGYQVRKHYKKVVWSVGITLEAKWSWVAGISH